MAPSPDNRFALSADLGLDHLFVYKLDYKLDPKTGTLTANAHPWGSLKPGAGPGHLDFSRNGKFVYVINEMASTITAFSWNGGVYLVRWGSKTKT